MKLRIALTTILLLGFGHANAVTITSLVGDKDCFGIGSAQCAAAGGVPADGLGFVSDLGGSFFTDYRSPAEIADPNASVTDIWDAPGGFNYNHSYALGGAATSAFLDIQIAGIADIASAAGYDILVDGTVVGNIPQNNSANNFEEVLLYSFAIPTALINGTDTINVSGTGGDGFIINFSELRIETLAAPEPATLLLFGLGLLGVSLARRKS